ncbi:MAG: hypothetical protein WKG03_00165 [Telluria sp.]
MTTMPPKEVPPLNPRSLHTPFSWLGDEDKGNPAAIRNAEAMDVFRGIATCLQLIEMSNLDREMSGSAEDDRITPILSVSDTAKLMRLAILVATEWGNKADCAMLGINDEHAGSEK